MLQGRVGDACRSRSLVLLGTVAASVNALSHVLDCASLNMGEIVIYITIEVLSSYTMEGLRNGTFKSFDLILCSYWLEGR